VHRQRRHRRTRCEQELESGCERALWPQHVHSTLPGSLSSGPRPAASWASRGLIDPGGGVTGKIGIDTATSAHSLDLPYLTRVAPVQAILRQPSTAEWLGLMRMVLAAEYT
jgi:hypothetical protein